jgi:paraquat-inducible protein B|tara:strand:+ start:697 stop:1383 length:687 start_codon:yes stop_codon:yes gene_type:complete
MKLAEMSLTSAKKINKVLESRFGFAINYDSLTVEKAEKLSETIAANLDKIRHSANLHTAETNPRYMELLTVKEGLSRWLEENANTTTEAEIINEGEVGNAEVLLAAKDMVDSIQDAIEKVGKMQNEQLPQLLDSIRDQIGSEQSDGFKNAVGTTLDTLMTQLQTAREGVDNGVKILTGEQTDNPMAMPDELPAELPAPESDLDADETDGFAATDAATGGAEELGRELR